MVVGTEHFEDKYNQIDNATVAKKELNLKAESTTVHYKSA